MYLYNTESHHPDVQLCVLQFVMCLSIMHLIYQTSAVQSVHSAHSGLILLLILPTPPQLAAGSGADEYAQGRQATVWGRDAALFL